MPHAKPPHHAAEDSVTRRRLALITTTAVLAVTALVTFAVPRAGAVSDAEELTRIGIEGTGAGEFGSALGGLASDPVTGHLFAVEGSRINEFTPWGNFVKAFGWDVAPGAVNEQQEVRERAASGQFKLSFGAPSTPDLPFDAGGAEVEAALNALASIGGVGGAVSVESVLGPPDGKTPSVYVVTFKGSLAATDVAELTIANGTTQLSGGVPSTTLEARTRADGHAATSGLESCTAESGCQVGLEGPGAGQLGRAEGAAVDHAGNLYVKEFSNLRAQKFDSAGRFVLMFGGEVNKTTSENVCTKAQLEAGDECGIGLGGTEPGWFSFGFSRSVTLGSSGQLFVADKERFQRFNAQGEFEAQVPVPGETIGYLAFDPVSEDLYATYAEVGVHRLNSITGAEIGELEGQGMLATDLSGNLYAKGTGEKNQEKIVQYDSGGKPLTPFTCCQPPLVPNDITQIRFGLVQLGTNAAGTLYVTYAHPPDDIFIRVFGPGPTMFEAPPKVPPTISNQYATSVDRTGAVLGADINPHFWIDTRFYVEYGTGKCSEGGCEEVKPLPPGPILSSKPFSAAIRSSSVFLEGLEPGTTYHYRFVAVSSGGGPVHGIGGEVGVDGEESTFTTYPVLSQFKADCPNQSFRTGFSAPLVDCRAYEMVSPIEKNNGDIVSLVDLPGFTTDLEQSSTDGNRFTYSSYRPFADPESGAYTMQYLASRQDGVGWSNKAINPPHFHAGSAGSTSLEAAYRAFSADLCSGWLVAAPEPPLAPGAPEGYRSLYRRDNCTGGYEAVSVGQPTVDPLDFDTYEFQGASADGKEAIFRVEDKLTEDAASDVWQAYYASGEELRLLCVLPSGAPSGGNCSGGSAGTPPQILSRLSSVVNAISADGRRAYWTDSGSSESGPGKVYLRVNPGEEQSQLSGGECTEVEKACTFEVSETVSSKASRFLGASTDGSKALFEVTEGILVGNLYLFDSETQSSTLLAGKALGVAGASEDLSRIYFVSREVLPETSGASPGEPNLYLAGAGTATFIATLSDIDTESDFSNVSPLPLLHPARVSPDGSHLAFISTEPLSGYDNTDQRTGKADSEVYLYEAGSAGPVCVSCNPSGARPVGREVRRVIFSASSLPIAATIPPPRLMLDSMRPLSADGSRLFFNSYDALLPGDTNGKVDVYQWEQASGEADCKHKGAELYVPSSGGCLSLISSGQSPSDSQFLAASATGGDVFFTTNASLLPQDPGLIDVYDARVNGGLPGPPAPPGPCQGEACQLAPPPPNDPTPASASFKGAGNLKSTPRCRKGKVARKGRCVARKQKRSKKRHDRPQQTNHDRRGNR